MKKFIILVLICTLTSCGMLTSALEDLVEVENPSPVVEEVIKHTQESSDLIKKNTEETIRKAEEIKNDAKIIIDKVPPEVQPKIQPKVDKIDKNASAIISLKNDMKQQTVKMDELNNDLRAALININTITKQKTELLKRNHKLMEDLAKEKEEKRRALFSKLIYLIIASVVLGALCLVSAFRGETKAIWGAVVAAIIIITSLAISFYMTQFALVGFVAIVGGMALLAYNTYKAHCDKKANKELVHTVEVAKEHLSQEEQKNVFGNQSSLGQAHHIQSPSTVEIVQRLRRDRKTDWEPIVKKE